MAASVTLRQMRSTHRNRADVCVTFKKASLKCDIRMATGCCRSFGYAGQRSFSIFDAPSREGPFPTSKPYV